MEQFWEILVPVGHDGKPFHLTHHHTWDEKVRALTGGLTIYRSAQGDWRDTAGNIVRERMIPVRIACTESVILEVMKMTLEHYDQEEVLAFRVSDKVLRRKRG